MDMSFVWIEVRPGVSNLRRDTVGIVFRFAHKCYITLYINCLLFLVISICYSL